MSKSLAPMKLLAAAGLATSLALGAASAVAQSPVPNPAATPNPNPTTQAAKEEQLLQQSDRIRGRISIPDDKAAVLIQPEGRDWRQFRRGVLPWIGGILILGTIALLLVFYLWRGRIRVESGWSGRTILRFNGFERFVHWMTAMSFVILALTGLVISFGRQLLIPIMGHPAFTTFSQWGKYAHNYLSLPFAIGILFIMVMWFVHNIPNRADVNWLRQGGGLFGHGHHPPAGKFNAGQKGIFWAVVLGGLALIVTGIIMLFPFAVAGIAGMQTAQQIHAVVAMIMIAIVIAHIYIGTIGMEGAFSAMGTGEVDLNWAREHHSLWVEEAARKGSLGLSAGARPVPAE